MTFTEAVYNRATVLLYTLTADELARHLSRNMGVDAAVRFVEGWPDRTRRENAALSYLRETQSRANALAETRGY